MSLSHPLFPITLVRSDEAVFFLGYTCAQSCGTGLCGVVAASSRSAGSPRTRSEALSLRLFCCFLLFVTLLDDGTMQTDGSFAALACTRAEGEKTARQR